MPFPSFLCDGEQVVCGADLLHNHGLSPSSLTVVTFGEPRVGDGGFAMWLDTIANGAFYR